MGNITYLVGQRHTDVARLFKEYGIQQPVTEKTLSAAIVAYGSAFLEDLGDEIALTDYFGDEDDRFDNATGKANRQAKALARKEKRAEKKAVRQATKVAKQAAKAEKKAVQQGVYKQSIPGSTASSTLAILDKVGQYAQTAGAVAAGAGAAVADAMAAGAGIAEQVQELGEDGETYEVPYGLPETETKKDKKTWLPWVIGGGAGLALLIVLLVVFMGKRGK